MEKLGSGISNIARSGSSVQLSIGSMIDPSAINELNTPPGLKLIRVLFRSKNFKNAFLNP
jgi:hypothetical protein